MRSGSQWEWALRRRRYHREDTNILEKEKEQTQLGLEASHYHE